jgi:hypothetical protein
MLASLRRIQDDLGRAEHDVHVFINALKGIGSRWASIQTSFSDHPEFLGSYVRDFPNLRCSVELEQLSICDLLVAEIARGLVMLEQAIRMSHAAFGKVKQTPRTKDLAELWSFPPIDTFVGDVLIETGDRIDSVARQTGARRLALYRLNCEEGSTSPEAIRTFVTGWEAG